MTQQNERLGQRKRERERGIQKRHSKSEAHPPLSSSSSHPLHWLGLYRLVCWRVAAAALQLNTNSHGTTQCILNKVFSYRPSNSWVHSADHPHIIISHTEQQQQHQHPQPIWAQPTNSCLSLAAFISTYQEQSSGGFISLPFTARWNRIMRAPTHVCLRLEDKRPSVMFHEWDGGAYAKYEYCCVHELWFEEYKRCCQSISICLGFQWNLIQLWHVSQLLIKLLLTFLWKHFK